MDIRPNDQPPLTSFQSDSAIHAVVMMDIPKSHPLGSVPTQSMVIKSRAHRAGVVPKRSALARATIPEFHDFAKSGNSQFAMRVSISVALVFGSKILHQYLSAGCSRFTNPCFISAWRFYSQTSITATIILYNPADTKLQSAVRIAFRRLEMESCGEWVD